MNFTENQIHRYSRHIILDEVGGSGQEKLLNSKVLIVGAGGLGSPAALYLAASGIGTIGIVDYDNVDLTNLQRQIIHFTDDIGRKKTESAKNKLSLLNPDVNVLTYNEMIKSDNFAQIFSDQNYDFIIDAVDNFPAKFLINDFCVLNKIPFSHGGILRFIGQTFTYKHGNVCYRCMFETPPPKGEVPTCSQAGVLGAIAGMLGTIQAAEAIKSILNIGENLLNRLLMFDALKMDFNIVNIEKNKDCPICGENPTITKLIDEEQYECK